MQSPQTWPDLKHRTIGLFLICATVACGSSTDSSDDPEEPAALAGILAAHNEARAAVGVGALRWDDDLAATAQAWAEAGTDTVSPIGLLDTNDHRSDGYAFYVGENIHASTGTVTGSGAVDSWVAEAANYNYAANTCSSTCARYTQVVWAATTTVGCGISHRPALAFPNTIVCNYGPGGNDGGRPY